MPPAKRHTLKAITLHWPSSLQFFKNQSQILRAKGGAERAQSSLLNCLILLRALGFWETSCGHKAGDYRAMSDCEASCSHLDYFVRILQLWLCQSRLVLQPAAGRKHNATSTQRRTSLIHILNSAHDDHANLYNSFEHI